MTAAYKGCQLIAYMKQILTTVFLFRALIAFANEKHKEPVVAIWTPFEISKHSAIAYAHPIYDVTMEAIFTAPSGEQYSAAAFWDGGNNWKIRFMPNETGVWHYRTYASDTSNRALHHQTGTFVCRKRKTPLAIYAHGKLTHAPGNYHITHADGTPFFYLGCTAWNGALRSTEEEWETYLSHRSGNNYTVIQFITTQWRGLPAEAFHSAPFSGVDTLVINPAFFQALDKKFEQINAHGLVAAPIMLWAWKGGGSPGTDLPTASAVKLAKYLKARYDAYHVIWNLGGDGIFTGDQAEKWKQIGRTVFGESRARQSMVTLHTAGFQWYAPVYDDEAWLDMVSYQTGHANSEAAVRWKSHGPVVHDWSSLTPRPIIDTEPVYERQGNDGNDYEVRKSILWSIFSAPVAGVGYGAWSTWPWLRLGETSYNHGMKTPSAYAWLDGIHSAASIQIGRLPTFFNRFNWWDLRPVQEGTITQNSENGIFGTVMALADKRTGTMLIYIPTAQTFRMGYADTNSIQTAQWYYPETGDYEPARLTRGTDYVEATSTSRTDAILVIRTKQRALK